MPIKPTPTTYRCPKCGWKTVFAPKSDVLIQPPPSTCPKCGAETEAEKASALDVMVDSVKGLFGRG